MATLTAAAALIIRTAGAIDTMNYDTTNRQATARDSP